jgi:hypothetical protein
MAARSWSNSDDENRVKQGLSDLLKRNFRGIYIPLAMTLAMTMDLLKELPAP